MRLQLSASSYGNKGAIFSIDAAIAFFIVAIVLASSSYYVSKQTEEHLANLQMYKAGFDVVTILDYKGVLNTTDNETLEKEMLNLTATNYLMKMKIDGNFTNSPITTNLTSPTESLVISGERPIMRNGEGAIARFWIWPR